MPHAESSQATMPRGDSFAPDAPLPLEAVIVTSELMRRPSRARDTAAEHRAVTQLMEEMASGSGSAGSDRILRRLVDTALCLCKADVAGLSMLETDGEQELFRWRAIAGQWAHFTGGSIPCEQSACGVVVDRNAPVLMERPQRHYRALPTEEPISEMLMIPFHFEDRPVGTLWLVSLNENARLFDAEDLRLLTSLARFAAIAYRLTLSQDSVQQLRLESELADSRLLQAISSDLITENDEKGFRERLLDAAISIMHSDCASLQWFREDSGGGHLELIAHRGFS